MSETILVLLVAEALLALLADNPMRPDLRAHIEEYVAKVKKDKEDYLALREAMLGFLTPQAKGKPD